MQTNKYLWWTATAMAAWALYAATFDTTGRFDPVAEFDVVEYRIGSRLGIVAKRANQTIVDQNRGMQGVVNGREHRVNSRVDENKDR